VENQEQIEDLFFMAEDIDARSNAASGSSAACFARDTSSSLHISQLSRLME